MRRALLNLVLPLCLLATIPAKAASTTAGLVLTTPEMIGAIVSFWPTSTTTIDLRGTLGSIDAGVTGHIPISGAMGGTRHSFLLTGMGGVAYGSHHYYGDSANSGFHWIAMAGYGLLINTFDLRLEAGLAGARNSLDTWSTGMTAQIVLGKMF